MEPQELAVSERVVWDVASATDSDPSELPPLYGSIDPDALDALVGRMAAGEIRFEYAGHDVSVRDDGSIDLVERQDNSGDAGVAASSD